MEIKAWKHPNGKLFETKKDFDNYVLYLKNQEEDHKKREKARVERKIKLIKQKSKLVKNLAKARKEYREMQALRPAYNIRKANYISSKTAYTVNKINEFETTINKAQLGLKVCRKSLTHQKRELIKEFIQKDPFSERRLNALRRRVWCIDSKIYNISRDLNLNYGTT